METCFGRKEGANKAWNAVGTGEGLGVKTKPTKIIGSAEIISQKTSFLL
jgi:hypothetical protein